MTEPATLPELPPEQVPAESWKRESRQIVREKFRHSREALGLTEEDLRIFSADQMRAYGLACYRAGMERAAEIAEGTYEDYPALLAANRCATAIRREADRAARDQKDEPK